jgi:hypothetical protein
MLTSFAVTTTANADDTLVLRFTANSAFDITKVEEVVFTPLAKHVASQLLPTVLLGPTQSDRFGIAPSPGTLAALAVTITEANFHNAARNVSFSFARGETFRGDAALAFNASLQSNQQPSGSNFASLSATILPLSGFVVTNGNRTLTLLIHNSSYDINVTEIVTMTTTAAMVSSNIAPASTARNHHNHAIAGSAERYAFRRIRPVVHPHREAAARRGRDFLAVMVVGFRDLASYLFHRELHHHRRR